MDPQVLDSIEKDLLHLIVMHLEQNKIDVQTAQKLAHDFLAVLPVSSREELLDKLKSLGETYYEAKQVYFQETSKDTKVQEQHALNRMSDAIKQGEIDKALSIAKDLQQKN